MATVRSPLMAVRRAFFVEQFVAVVVLPVWVIVGWSIWGPGSAPGSVNLTPFLVVMIAVLGQTALAVLFSLRSSVRRDRAVSGLDAVVLAVFAAALIGAGFFGTAISAFLGLAVVSVVAGGWLGIVELLRELRARVRSTLSSLGITRRQAPVDRGEYVVLPPQR
ncbi:hypothetical protein [uncultured Amnibacterium sp.]|uniref:hypothetical protein n=1 Tax=uncultured Amnibacterium sp. TaxID=1631851 RepID=UPI0035CBBA66